MISLNDVLLAASNIPVDDPLAEMWGAMLRGGYTPIIVKYTGALPITINAKGDALIDYRIYGASGGVGEPTENLFDESTVESDGYIDPHSGDFVSHNAWVSSDYIKVTGDYINLSGELIAYFGGWAIIHNFYDNNKSWLSGENTLQGVGTIGARGSVSLAISGVSYVRVSYRYVIFDDIMLVEGSTNPASYIPYGYKLPMVASTQNLLPDNISQFRNGYISVFGNVYPQDTTNKEKYSDYISIAPNTSYTFAMTNGFPGNPSGSVDTKPWRTIAFYGQNKTFISRNPESIDVARKPIPFTVTSPSDAFFTRVTWRSYGSEECPVLVTNRDIYPVYIGDSPLDAIGEWSDYVDYASGKIVRKIAEYTFTGEENFYSFYLGFYTKKMFSDGYSGHGITTRFSHFTARTNTGLGAMSSVSFGDDCACFRLDDGNVMLRSTANFTTVETCKQYFKDQYDNGTPVKMWYVLETPIEEDPPVPLPEIPTIDGTTVIDCELADKPSQMYVKYIRGGEIT